VLHEPTKGAMYLYSNNELRHIPDPPTFDLLGLSWASAIDITNKDLSSYKISTPITSLKEMKLYRYRGNVYGLVNEKLKHIPNVATLQYIFGQRSDRSIVELNSLIGYTIDKPFANIS
jgi:hypothetical protein